MSEFESVFAQKLAAKRAEAIAQGKYAPTVVPPPVPATPKVKYDDDLIPKPQDDGVDDPNEAIVDALIDRIGIIEGYERWIGGFIEPARGRTESIMCQCPYPNHTDEKPSAWVNTLNNTFYCGGCSRGGDQVVLAAIKYGYVTSAQDSAPTGKAFHDLRRQIAREFGIEAIRRGDGPWRYVVAGGSNDPDPGGERLVPGGPGAQAAAHGGDREAGAAVRSAGGREAPAGTAGGELAVDAGRVRLDPAGPAAVRAVPGAVLGGTEELGGPDRQGARADGAESGRQADRGLIDERHEPTGEGRPDGEHGHSGDAVGSELGSVDDAGVPAAGGGASAEQQAPGLGAGPREGDQGSQAPSLAPGVGSFTLKIPKKPFSIAENGEATPTVQPQKPVAAPVREPEKTPLATVTSITGEPIDQDETPEAPLPGLDWTQIVPEGTYLDAVMQATKVDDVPEEYHFWHAMVSVGLAMGRDVTTDEMPNVHANLFMCILGRTGAGKSKSRAHFNQIFKETMPFDPVDVSNDGVRLIGAPGSGEVMVDLFTRSIPDPTIKGKINQSGNIRGLVDFNEFSALMARAGRSHSTLESTLIQFYDAQDSISSNTRGHGTVDATNSFCCVMTTTQPASLAGLVSQADATSGFLNRWIFVTGTPKRPQSITRGTIDVSEPIRLMKKIVDWTSPTRKLPWSEAAEKRYDEFFHSTIHPLKATDETSLLSRTDLLMKKLTLIFTGNMASLDEDLNEIPEEAVNQAIKCWPYLVACYALVDDRIVTSKLNDVETLILDKINDAWANKKAPLSARDIMQKVKRKVSGTEELARILRSMGDLGLIEKIETNAGKVGRPSVKFYPAGAL